MHISLTACLLWDGVMLLASLWCSGHGTFKGVAISNLQQIGLSCFIPSFLILSFHYVFIVLIFFSS